MMTLWRENPRNRKETDMADRKTIRSPGSEQQHPTPGTDPTNPYAQETTGEFAASEVGAEKREKEPGLTDEERQRRHPTR
jgi:hypothetical protein